MDKKQQDNGVELPVRFPGALSLKDLITVVSVAVSLTIAWGVFGTRITLLEKEVSVHESEDSRVQQDVATLKMRVDAIQQRQYDNENMIDRLYENSKLPEPKRRPPY